MRNYKKYRLTVIDLFQSFLAEKISREQLIRGLNAIWNELRDWKHTEKELWFRFFKGDTLATTIYDLENSVDCSTNGKFTRECMQIAIDNPKGLQIYYS